MRDVPMNRDEITLLVRLLGHHTVSGGKLEHLFNRLCDIERERLGRRQDIFGTPFVSQEHRINREMYGDRPMIVVE